MKYSFFSIHDNILDTLLRILMAGYSIHGEINLFLLTYTFSFSSIFLLNPQLITYVRGTKVGPCMFLLNNFKLNHTKHKI